MNFKAFLLIFTLPTFLSQYPPIFTDISNISIKSNYRYIHNYRNCVPCLHLKSSPCVFLGYSLHQIANIFLDVKTNKIFHSRHVKFVECEHPFSNICPSSTSSPIWSSSFVMASQAPITTVLCSLPTSSPRSSLALIFEEDSLSSSTSGFSSNSISQIPSSQGETHINRPHTSYQPLSTTTSKASLQEKMSSLTVFHCQVNGYLSK